MQPHHSEYEFIMNPNGGPAPKRPLLPTGNSMKQRILIIGALVAVLLIIVIVIGRLISSAGNANRAELVNVLQQQAEIVRVSKIGVERARGPSAKNLAATTSLSLQSDQATLVAIAKAQGITVDIKEVALGKNEKTDTVLTSAEQSNRFDEIFVETIQQHLSTYQNTLKNAYDNTSNAKLKQTLSSQHEHAGLLAKAKQ